MSKTFKLLGLISLMVVFMASCSKDDDSPEEVAKTTKDYLTAGYWKMTAMTVDPAIFTITDIYAQFPACAKDDLTKFNTDGTITDDEGATKCDPNDPQTSNDGTWVLSADNTSVTMSYPGEEPTTIIITQVDGSVFKGNFIVVEDNGAGTLTYTYSVTMTLQ